MLAKSSPITHKASGATIRTPLLVPSFSSKGLAATRASADSSLPASVGAPQVRPASDIENILRFAGEFLTHTCLVSAYDLYYRLIPQLAELPNVEMLFLDSGGYEVSMDQDLSTIVSEPSGEKAWEPHMHREVVAAWPADRPTVLVSFDHPQRRLELSDQLREARELFTSSAGHLSLFLVKPENSGEDSLDSVLGKLVANPRALATFDIIGVTEKELGPSIISRMLQIASLRIALDREGIRSPIHVFGALDPMSVCFYFVAGAEIFDGLTWMRYAYDSGRCVYFSNYGAAMYDLYTKDQQVRSRAMTGNIYALESLEHSMREFLLTADYSKLGADGMLVKRAVDSLKAKLGGG